MSYDPKCYDLAAAFVDDINRTERLGLTEPAIIGFIDELAQHIQTEIENYLEYDPRFRVVRESAWDPNDGKVGATDV